MPTFFSENNTPRIKDSLWRMSQKILGGVTNVVDGMNPTGATSVVITPIAGADVRANWVSVLDSPGFWIFSKSVNEADWVEFIGEPPDLRVENFDMAPAVAGNTVQLRMHAANNSNFRVGPYIYSNVVTLIA